MTRGRSGALRDVKSCKDSGSEVRCGPHPGCATYELCDVSFPFASVKWILCLVDCLQG